MTRDQRPINYYDILGVDSTASIDEIRAAYRARISQYHPDKNRSTHANAIAALINEAGEVLGTPERRRRYDAEYFSPAGTASQSSEHEPNSTSPI